MACGAALSLWRWGSSLPLSQHGLSTHHTAQRRLPWDWSPLTHQSGECRPQGSHAHTPCAQPQEWTLHVGSLQAATPSDGRQDWTSPLTGGRDATLTQPHMGMPAQPAKPHGFGLFD